MRDVQNDDRLRRGREVGETILVWVSVLREAFNLYAGIIDLQQRWEAAINELERRAVTAQERERAVRRAIVRRRYEELNIRAQEQFNAADQSQFKEALRSYEQALNLLNIELQDIQLDVNNSREQINRFEQEVMQLEVQYNNNVETYNMNAIWVTLFPLAVINKYIDLPRSRERLAEAREKLADANQKNILAQEEHRRFSQVLLLSLYHNIATTLYNLGRYEKAIHYLNQIIVIKPENIPALNLRGLSYAQLKDKANTPQERYQYSVFARQDFAESIRIRGDQDRIKALLAYERSNWNDVIRDSINAIGNNIEEARDTLLLYILGHALLQLNRHQEALRYFNQALQILRPAVRVESSMREKVYVMQARCYQGLGNIVAARNSYRRALCLNVRNREALDQLSVLGDAQAKNYLGIRFFEDYTTNPQNIPAENGRDALRWITESVNQGNAAAQASRGLLSEMGFGVPRDPGLARQWYEAGERLGCVAAKTNLARFHQDGIGGIPVDQARAQQLLVEAAERGYSLAHHNLGYRYCHGMGVPQNRQIAFFHFSDAATQGFSYSQYSLGVMYETGNGLPPNERIDTGKALKLYKKAAKQGLSIAMFRCGHFCENGIGTPQNMQAAIAFYKAASARGDNDAQAALVRLFQAGHAELINRTPIDPAYQSPFSKRPARVPHGENGGFIFEQEAPPQHQHERRI